MKAIDNFLTAAVILAASVVIFPAVGFAQVFDSTSTGADGDFNRPCTPDPETWDVVLDVGPTGIMNYNSFILGEDCILTFTPTGTGSSPVRLLVAGDVVIDGKINLNGAIGTGPIEGAGGLGGVGGPGGGDGGQGGSTGAYPTCAGDGGYGVGAGLGSSNCLSEGVFGYIAVSRADPYSQPLVGGGGGAGGSYSIATAGGGGGAGALLIAASGTVTIGATGSIYAEGGDR